MLCVSVFVLRFPLFCKFVFVFCRSSDEVEGERRLSSPLMFSINFKSVLQFPSRSPFQFLQTLQSTNVSNKPLKITKIRIPKYTNIQIYKHTNIQIQKYTNIQFNCYEKFQLKNPTRKSLWSNVIIEVVWSFRQLWKRETQISIFVCSWF